MYIDKLDGRIDAEFFDRKKGAYRVFVLSNYTCKDGQLTAEYRQPFDLLAKNVLTLERKMPAENPKTGISEKWLPFVDAYRTICIAPPPVARVALDGIQKFSVPV